MDNLSHLFDDLLLGDIVIRTETNVLRRGILKMFNVKQFYIRLTLQNIKSGKDSLYEIPYPYNIRRENGIIILDFKMDSFCPDESHMNIVKSIRDKATTNPSRVHDKIVYILPFKDSIV